MGADVKRFEVMVLKKLPTGDREFHSAGVAFVNRDGTMTVHAELPAWVGESVTLMLRPKEGR